MNKNLKWYVPPNRILAYLVKPIIPFFFVFEGPKDRPLMRYEYDICNRYEILLTSYWSSIRKTVVSLGSNLKTCFKSAGPNIASSRAQSI